MEILVAQKASFTYQNKSQSVKAVREVSCSFELGKCYAIVGKSGSGKTTLLSLLAGLELPTEGKILYDGIATSEMDCDDYRKDHAAVIYGLGRFRQSRCPGGTIRAERIPSDLRTPWGCR